MEQRCNDAQQLLKHQHETENNIALILLLVLLRWTEKEVYLLFELTDIIRGLLQIFLVGTAHVSRNSAEEVRELIRVVKPTSVMVELCEARARRIRASAQVRQICHASAVT